MKYINKGINELLSTKQRYKMKAIHNAAAGAYFAWKTVVNKAKIQNESNSQLKTYNKIKGKNCCQQSKDTK